jgi:molecular chaperone GrpE
MMHENSRPLTEAAAGETQATDMESQPPCENRGLPQAEVQPNSVAALQAELEKAQAQAAEYLDGWQRARAEFANFKRRVEVEREDIRYRSNETLLLKLLPVVDDFERAMQVVPAEVADTPWVNGVAMILNKLQALLESEDVAVVQTVGQPFDPQWHEAMMQEETDEYPDGTVVQELRKGYRLSDRPLRPALVKVASNSKKEPTTAADV